MMKLLVTTAVLASLMLMSTGCAYWQQNGKSYYEADCAMQDCLAQLAETSDMRNVNSYETEFVECCMQSKGYSLKTARKLYGSERRQLPELSKYWLTKGIAGCAEENIE